jgi:predicted nucleic acid-binding protein
MEVLNGRVANIRTAANRDELQKAMERFLASESLLDSFIRPDTNEATGEHFERLLKHTKAKKMKRGDMLIASIALANDALLVTRNVNDFKDVPGLRMENWVD